MQALEEKLQYHFKNLALLEEALRHSSYANEHRGANFFSNERLEFLGDSVLGFVTAEYLFAKHPTAPEGELTRIRALLVCEDSLARGRAAPGAWKILKARQRRGELRRPHASVYPGRRDRGGVCRGVS